MLSRARASLAPLSSRDFRLFAASRLASGAALTLLRAQVLWHVHALTGSPFHLGLVGLMQFLPALGLSLVGGAVADAWDRRRVALAAQVVPLCATLVLHVATARATLDLPLLYGMVLVVSIAGSFESPARTALLPSLVPRALFPRAVVLYSGVQMLAFLSGPAVQGVLVTARSAAAPYAAHAGLTLVSIALLWRVRPRALEGPPRTISLAAIREGLSFVRRNEVVLGCMSLDMFAVLFGGAAALLPIYAKDILHAGDLGYSLLVSSLELGAFLMWALFLWLPPIRRAGRALLLAVVVFACATIVFGLSRSFPLSLAAYMLVGMADYVSVVMRGVAIQLSTPDHLRGRVSSVNMIFIGASNQLGAVESGFVAALTSATFAVVSGGAASLVAALAIAARLPGLRRWEIADERDGDRP